MCSASNQWSTQTPSYPLRVSFGGWRDSCLFSSWLVGQDDLLRRGSASVLQRVPPSWPPGSCPSPAPPYIFAEFDVSAGPSFTSQLKHCEGWQFMFHWLCSRLQLHVINYIINCFRVESGVRYAHTLQIGIAKGVNVGGVEYTNTPLTWKSPKGRPPCEATRMWNLVMW